MTQDTTQVVSAFSDDPVERRVLEIIVERTQTPIEQMNRDTLMIPDVTDSLGVTEVIMDLEEEFEGSIPDESANQIQTVGQLIDHVKTHLASVKTGP
jgi:acyl carrier protein